MRPAATSARNRHFVGNEGVSGVGPGEIQARSTAVAPRTARKAAEDGATAFAERSRARKRDGPGPGPGDLPGREHLEDRRPATVGHGLVGPPTEQSLDDAHDTRKT
jgi:hypothetical protein